MGYIIGIDQGGTKTHAAIMRSDGTILSYHETEGCYFPDTGIDQAMIYIVGAVEETLKKAQVPIDEVETIVAGVTGIDYDGDAGIVASAMQEAFVQQEIIVCNDCEIAYFSGTLKPVGAVLCAGTGVNAAFFSPEGNSLVMSDYFKSSLQGGAAIARRAIEAVVEADLGVYPASQLTKIFLDFAKVDSVNSLLRLYVRSEDFNDSILTLVPQIVKIANDNDFLAQKVLSDYAEELCTCFLAAFRKMKMTDLECDVVIAGSVFKGETNYLTTQVVGRILVEARNVKIVNAKYEPIVGALILGMINRYAEFNKEMDEKARSSAEKLGLLRYCEERV